MRRVKAELAAWYQDLSNGKLFEVVAFDDASGTIEYQDVDGEVGEYDNLTWSSLNLAAAEAPEDWTSPYELCREDCTNSDNAQVPENWSGALSEIEPELLDMGDDFKFF